MKCDPQALSALLAGTLAGEDKSAAEAHLAWCPDCRTRQRRLESSRTAFSELAPLSPRPGFAGRLARRLNAAAEPRRDFLEWPAWRPAFAFAAAAAAWAVLFVWHRAPRPPAQPPGVSTPTPGLDAGRLDFDSAESPCASSQDCG